MPIEELEGLGGLGAELGRRARAAGALLIWRAQVLSRRSVLVRRGKVESSSHVTTAGHGVQIVTPEGHSALASRDDFREQPALELLGRVLEAAAQGSELGLHAVELPDLVPCTGREIPASSDGFEDVDLSEVARRLIEVESETAGRVPGAGLRIGFRAELDAWRVLRSDGTDVLFAMPRCTLNLRASSNGDGGRHNVGVGMHHPDPECLRDDNFIRTFLRRAEEAARLALDLPHAPTHPAGSFPLVIDYALAKGLAHEAFGHASEADGYRSSILARDGRLRIGDRVGADHVSVIDEPVAGDHAWQPFSANGVPRRRAVVVDRGRLLEGLSDPWSAVAGGVGLSGAGRAESFRNAPVPRMTNIRVEVDAPLPAAGEFEDYGPERVRDLLAAAGVFRRHPEVVFLSGYSGGQVNTAVGDFVFHCKAIYSLSERGVRLFKPAIFSGSMFGALHAIREAFGPLRLDAIGYCGKWGQSVPSSGGSHYFLVLDPDPEIRLGGA